MAVERIYDISGGIQTGSNWLLKASNQLEDAENARFDYEVGGAVRRKGYTRRLTTGTNEESLGFHEAKFDEGPIMFTASDNGTNTVIKAIDEAGTVTTVINDLPRHTRCQFLDHLNEVYVAGMTTDTGERIQPRNIRLVAGVPTVSLTRNLYTAPKAAYVGENSGKLYLMNVELDGTVYPDRAYESSPPMGAITFIKGDQNNVYAPVTLVSQVPKMSDYSVPSGTAAASTEVNTSNRAWQAFDRDTGNNRWLANTTTGWIRYDFGASNSKVIQYYSITSQNDTLRHRDPKDWTFQGSNDASAWTTIHTVASEPAWNQNETRTYSTSNTTAYRYYRINITAPQTVTDYVGMKEVQFYSQLGGTTRYRQAAVDSVRYVKAGMVVDIYKAGTDTKLRSITVDSVDRAKDTFNYLPFEQTGLSAATTDIITIASGTFDATEFATGQAVVFSGTGTPPGGITFGTTYYVIRTGNANEIKVAASYDQAVIGQAVDITSTGTAGFTISVSYVFSDNDEIWLKDRHEDLSVLWNTDYRTPQTADYLRIPSGSTSDTAISGWIKSNNRMNIFTPTSMFQYDNANFIPIFEDIGCISHWTIKNAGQWIIWLDATGKVRARDSSSGQDEIISRFVRNRILDQVPAENLPFASASMFDGNYKLNLGQVNGKYMRMVYNFDNNAWWRESHVRHLKYNVISRISGKDRLYWVSDGLAMYLDEEGDLDYDSTIPYMLHYGKRAMGSMFKKALLGFYVLGEGISSASIAVKKASSKDWIMIGQLTEPVSRVVLGDKKNIEDRYFDIKISHHAKGSAPRVDAMEVHFNLLEENFG